MSTFAFMSLALWIGIVALQLADLTLTASRVPQLSAFSALRDELRAAAGQRLVDDQLDDFRQRFMTIDDSETTRAVPPARGVNAQLWKGVPWHLAAVALSFLPLVSAIVDGPAQPGVPVHPAVLLVGVLLPVIGYVLGLAVARASIAAAHARSSLYSHQRAEIVELLDAAAKTSRKKVAGLGDRVARALQILREQQAERP